MSRRAGRVCSTPGCPNLQPCATHARKPWADSDGGNRNRHLPAGWTTTRRRILRRDHGICHVCGRPGADQVDHVVPRTAGGGEDDSNLAAIHARPCHAEKSERERRRAT